MKRDALIWIAMGAFAASASWLLVNVLSQPKKEPALVVLDNFPDELYEKRKAEAEDFLPRSAYQCKIGQFTYNVAIPDGYGELFVPISRNSPDAINCLLDIAKEWQVTVRFTNEFGWSMADKTAQTEKK